VEKTVAVDRAAWRLRVSVGFQLLARFERTLASPDEILLEMESWVKAYSMDLAPSTRIGFSEATPTLFCRLHPAAEEVELSILDLDHFVASAKTSTVGPGYHIFVCDMVRKLGKEFLLNWDTNNEEYFDEGDYFFSENRDRVFEEMTAWLRGLCGCFFNGIFPEESTTPTALCLSISTAFEAETRAVTPLGPRDLGWLKRVSEDGERGRDFFAWWNPELNAEYFLGRALTRMWTDVRWRKPVSELERQTLNYVADSLETAFKLDPNLGCPRTEWAQILDFLQRHDSEIEFIRAHGDDAPLVGYRRRDVAVTLPGNWVIKLPGSFSEFNTDEEGDFSAQDPPRTIWFTSYKFVDNPAKMYEEARWKIVEECPELLEQRNGYLGKAKIQQKDGEDGNYFVLTSSNVCNKGRSVLTIVFTDEEERVWAERVWRSLQPPRVAGN
jgi:hypothetical protein